MNRFHSLFWCFHCWLWTSNCRLVKNFILVSIEFLNYFFSFWGPVYSKVNSNETHLKVLSRQSLWPIESSNKNTFHKETNFFICAPPYWALFHTVLSVYYLVALYRRCSRWLISSGKFVGKSEEMFALSSKSSPSNILPR